MTDASANGMPLMTGLTGPFYRRGAPGGLAEAMLGAAPCGSMDRHLVAPGQRVSGDTKAPMPLRLATATRSSCATGLRTLAEGAKARVEGVETAARSQATNVRVI